MYLLKKKISVHSDEYSHIIASPLENSINGVTRGDKDKCLQEIENEEAIYLISVGTAEVANMWWPSRPQSKDNVGRD